MPISRIELYNPSSYYDSSSNYEQILTTIFGVIWIITGALIYQVDFLVKRRLLSISLANISDQKESQPQIDHVDLEMNKLKGEQSLTEMKNPKRSPINSQISIISKPENYFEQGINLAKNAAQLTRNAKTKTDWYQVGITWTRTIETMKKVPNSDPNYQAAQQKIIDYQKYINYAKKAVDSPNIT